MLLSIFPPFREEIPTTLCRHAFCQLAPAKTGSSLTGESLGTNPTCTCQKLTKIIVIVICRKRDVINSSLPSPGQKNISDWGLPDDPKEDLLKL
jgi:hypothetical protein